jgi:hypothetical protein
MLMTASPSQLGLRTTTFLGAALGEESLMIRCKAGNFVNDGSTTGFPTPAIRRHLNPMPVPGATTSVLSQGAPLPKISL